MPSPPPSPNVISVDDLLVMPEIRELLTASVSDQTENSPVSPTQRSINHNTSSSLSDLSTSGFSQGEIDGEVGEQRLPVSPSSHSDQHRNIQEQNNKQKVDEEQDMAQQTSRSMSNATTIESGVEAQDILPPATNSDNYSESLSSGQHVHVLNAAEFDELCHRLQAQTASLSYDKHEKHEQNRQKLQIHELRAELHRLLQVEAELKQYEQRSVGSLEAELFAHQQEVNDLSTKLQTVAKEELDWINAMEERSRLSIFKH